MSDDLIQQLHHYANGECYMTPVGLKLLEAADRIKELESEVKQWHSEAMAWIEKWGTAEAKLAKALEALQFASAELLIIGVMGSYPTALPAADKARAVLAELEGPK